MRALNLGIAGIVCLLVVPVLVMLLHDVVLDFAAIIIFGGVGFGLLVLAILRRIHSQERR